MAIINAEGTPGGALYRAVNKVADGLKDEFPNVAVDTLAYQWGRPAPKITKVPLDLDAYLKIVLRILYACSLSVLCLNLAPRQHMPALEAQALEAEVLCRYFPSDPTPALCVPVFE